MNSEYYQNYKGPNLTKATLDTEDITDTIREFYGENNWKGKLWKFSDIFGENCKGKNIYCEFYSDDGRKHWFQGEVGEPTQIFNLPLATPINQNL